MSQLDIRKYDRIKNKTSVYTDELIATLMALG